MMPLISPNFFLDFTKYLVLIGICVLVKAAVSVRLYLSVLLTCFTVLFCFNTCTAAQIINK